MEEEKKEEVIEEVKEVNEVNEKVNEPVVVPTTVIEPEKKSKKKLIIILSIVGVVLIGIIVALILLLGGKKKYTVTFDTQGGNVIEKVEVEKGATVPRPATPVKEGYIFKGWEYAGTPYYFNIGISSDMTIKATWEEDTSHKEGDIIKVTFVYDNGDSDKVVEVTYGESLKRPDDPVYEGYEFDGWYKDGEDYEYTFYEEVTEEFTLTAKWEKQKDNEYIINFNTDGGSYVELQTVKKGNKVVEPKDPTKEGYTFVEWQLNNTKYDFSKEVTSNLTLQAKWKALPYDLTCTKEDTDDENIKMTLEVKATIEDDKVKSVLSTYTFTSNEDATKYCNKLKESKPELIECSDTKVVIKDIDEFSKAEGAEKLVGMSKVNFETTFKADGYTCK